MALGPEDSNYWKDLGTAHAELGRPDAAAADWAKVMELTPESKDPGLWWSPDPAGIGEALAPYDGIFARVVQIRPRDRILLIARLHYLGRRGRWREAAGIVAGIVALDPEDAFARDVHPALLLQTGDLEGHRRLFREAVALSVENDFRLAGVLLLGQCHLERPVRVSLISPETVPGTLDIHGRDSPAGGSSTERAATPRRSVISNKSPS